jgi:hypothetical protein
LKARLKRVGNVRANPDTSGFSSDNFHVEFMLIHTGSEGKTGSSTEERLAILKLVETSKINVDEAVKLLGCVGVFPSGS